MASTVLPNGIIIPEKYSRDWYADLYHNWQELDNLLGGGTPKDGTLTIQKNGDTVGTFSANQATDETINIEVPDVNNGTLTIQQNGTTVDTFTANSSSDKTVNIEVPTKTSDLNNDSGFITGVSWNDVADKPSFATVATSGSYNDLSNKPTIPTVNNGTLTIQQNGTTVDTFTANSSSDKTVNIECVDLTNNQTVGGNKEFTGTTTAHDLVPSATDTYNFGSSSYQWNNAYIKSLTINGVACGDILTHNASEFVDVSSNQTIDGVKTFSNEVTMFGRDINLMSRLHYDKNSNPSNTSWQYLFFRGNTTTEGYTNAWYSGYLEQVVNINGSVRGRWLVRDTSESVVCLELFVNGSNKQVKPTENNAVDLGTSTNKWKSFNGINPGALSLPSMSFISLDTTGFDVTATTIGTFTPTIDGWAILSITQKNKPFGIWILLGSYRVTFQSVHHGDDYMIFALIPVWTNLNLTIYCTADDIDSTRKVDWLRLFPCQGNV